MSKSSADAVSLKSAEKARADVVNTLQNVKSAKQIIDNRQSLTRDKVVQIAKHFDRAEGRKFENPKKQKKAPKKSAPHGYAKPKSK